MSLDHERTNGPMYLEFCLKLADTLTSNIDLRRITLFHQFKITDVLWGDYYNVLDVVTCDLLIVH